MFENVGEKLKSIAVASCVIGIVGSVLVGAVLFEISVLLGLVVIAVGSLGSWISALAIYALGLCAENAEMYPNGHSVKPSLPADVQNYLNKQTEQDKKETEKKKQEEKLRKEAELRQKIQNAGDGNWLSGFLAKANECANVREIKELGESIPKDECDATKELDKMINDLALVERSYGVSRKSVDKLLNRISELI